MLPEDDEMAVGQGSAASHLEHSGQMAQKYSCVPPCTHSHSHIVLSDFAACSNNDPCMHEESEIIIINISSF